MTLLSILVRLRLRRISARSNGSFAQGAEQLSITPDAVISSSPFAFSGDQQSATGCTIISPMGILGDDDGWRSDVSRVLVQRLARSHGLIVEEQVNRWGKDRDFASRGSAMPFPFFDDRLNAALRGCKTLLGENSIH
jgi:hypothetical protein